ncbi:MAG: 30S ribosomal protein S17 [Candidatus Omnitrophica bacterium CG1_02_44_16]|nr:MAG: 30S ribosomal protein S17 [Candidatus Omnitrophica bacterium CG1_02_44_16]PIY82817.1 MAG: 30S ribosomal protein S17 [Candidatus Omnitrophica bacterium CG_4_10_14_0_8_um_filter_44_12]PIZ84717.1 MAG: 30S ribosomal protein S17 [Candidatus Omnitrophica bacterium CG_4_10_14_0_2_um_filter_44_9]
MSAEQVQQDSKRKEFTGIVVSDKMKKTIVVEVTSLVRHGQYSKTIRRKERFKAHDEKNEARIGDIVLIHETRPMSKDKRWRLVEIITKAKITEALNDI